MTIKRLPMVAVTALVAGVLCVLSGCGYMTGRGYTPASLYPAGVETVYVAGFDNETFRQGLEVPLTRAISRELTEFSSLRLASKDTADSILTGRLVEFKETVAVKDEDDTILLKNVELTVSFAWRDRLTGTNIVPPRTLTERVRVVPGEITAEYNLREVAQRIAQSMQEDW